MSTSPARNRKPQSITNRRNTLLSPEAVSLLNERIVQEELSSRTYLAMSLWLSDNGFDGASKLWKKYSDEELVHANWARNYMLAMGEKPMTTSVLAPDITDFSGGLSQIIKLSFDHEIVITKQLKTGATFALTNGDHLLYTLMLTYLKEQVEEHEKMQKWVDRLTAFGEDRIALRMLDDEMGKSV